MATTDTSITFEKIEPKKSHRRASTGTFDIETTASKGLPHYLQASAGSCHDYCKYGNKSASETKARRVPLPIRFSATPDKSHQLAGTGNAVPRKTPVVTPKPSRNLKIQIPNKFEVINQDSPRSSKKIDAYLKQVKGTKGIDLKTNLLQTRATSLSSPKSVIRRHSDIIIPTKGLGAKEEFPVGSPSSRRNTEAKISKDTGTPKASKKSVLALTVSTSPKSRVKTVLSKFTGNGKSPRKVPNVTKQLSSRRLEPKQILEEEVVEKTLYVIEPNVENKSNTSISSPKSDKTASRSAHNEVQNLLSSESKEERETELADQKAENKGKPRRIGKMTSDDGDCSPRKLKFRRGKVVNVGSESSSPRKLKFKPGTVLGYNQNGRADDTRLRGSRRLVSDGASNGTKTESVMVVLRHQDVEGRKDIQSLFNNVIEETASKLVQTRKSKVKALVGAFESLSSLK